MKTTDLKKLLAATFMIAAFAAPSFSQTDTFTQCKQANDAVPGHKFSVSTTYFTFINSLPNSVSMYEFHFGYKITHKDKIEIKVATWSLFEPMGIPIWDPLLMKESEFYPGRIRESGIGMAYQRFLWKGFFTSIEILPLWKIYSDVNKIKIGNGFKLYTSYHLGYHVPLLKGRFYLEPQIHCNYWPIDSKGPEDFEEMENKWKNNYILFEPNIFIGISF